MNIKKLLHIDAWKFNWQKNFLMERIVSHCLIESIICFQLVSSVNIHASKRSQERLLGLAVAVCCILTRQALFDSS